MNWMDFVASLFKSIAWPTTVLILVFSFRALIKRVLANLTRVKYGELRMDFGRELKQVEKEAKAINIQPRPLRSIAPVKKEPLKLLEEAGQLASQYPEPAISVGWQAVEAQLKDSISGLQPEKRHEQFSLGTTLGNAEVLVGEKLIDFATFELIRSMYKLRNLAVHGQGGSITADEAYEFLAFAKGIVEKLRESRTH